MKQGKVSMVVPCYNKADYIGNMLDSVIAQEWDNIEVILVNDGSTDGTREIITGYEPKLRSRGYEVIIIDRDNAGCCAAVYAGLKRMTGDYFCLVDCDDEIEPKYVSHMAHWLDTHDDCEWAACTYRTVHLAGGNKKLSSPTEKTYRQDTDNLLEKYILRETVTTVWVYMSRVSYVKKCKLIENFCTERRKTYEPLIMVPLAHGKGKLEYFNEPMYLYNQTALDLFRFDKFEKCVQYYDDYLYLYEWSISRLDAMPDVKERMLAIAGLAYYRELAMAMPRIPDGKDFEHEVARMFTQTLDELFEPAPAIDAGLIREHGIVPLFKLISRNILNEQVTKKLPAGKVIGYGALGRSAAKRLPYLEKSKWHPTELWDKNGDGSFVKKPDFNSLTSEDLILLLPTAGSVINEFKNEAKDCPARVFEYNDIQDIIIETTFPQLMSARLK